MAQEKLTARMAQAAIPLSQAIANGTPLDFLRVKVSGRFRWEQTYWIYAAQSFDGLTQPGYRVVSVFEPIDNKPVLVERGWVAGLKPPKTPPSDAPLSDVEIEGVLRAPAKPGSFTPAPDLQTRVLYALDTAAIARLSSLELATPYSIRLLSAAQTPLGPETGLKLLPFEAQLTNNHGGYALTWYSLALVLLGMYGALHAAKGRLKIVR